MPEFSWTPAPAQAMAARLHERANLKPDDITHVFLTCFKPEARRRFTVRLLRVRGLGFD